MSALQYPDFESIIEMLVEKRALVVETMSMQSEWTTLRKGDATDCIVTMSYPGDTSNTTKNDSTLPDSTGDTSLQLSDASNGSSVPTDFDMSPETSLNDVVLYEHIQTSYAEYGFSAICDMATNPGQFKTALPVAILLSTFYDGDESASEEDEAGSNFSTPVEINSTMETQVTEYSEQLEGSDAESLETHADNMSQIQTATEDLNRTGFLCISRNEKVVKIFKCVVFVLFSVALFFGLYLIGEIN